MATPPDLLLHTSALLSRWVLGPGTDAMVELLSRPDLRGRLVCAAHVEGEFVAAMNAAHRRRELDLRRLRAAVAGFYQQFPDLFAIVPLSADVLWRGHLLLHTHPEAGVHAADVYHLAALDYAAAALDSHPFVFVSTNRPLLRLAEALAFPTWDPAGAAPAPLLA